MKRLIPVLLICLGIVPFAATSNAEDIKVGLEPMPPLITEDGKGYTVDMLRAIEKISDLRFIITMMPYNRAKKSLKDGVIDLMAHTPFKAESKEFYEYAQELNWSIAAATDFYSTDKQKLDNPGKYIIGTQRGNKEFFAEATKINVNQFYESEIDSLLKMLVTKRNVEIVMWERSATMSTIKKLNLKNIYYKEMLPVIEATICVSKRATGNRLKKEMDRKIPLLDLKKIFAKQNLFLDMPDSGIVTWETWPSDILNN